LQGKRKGKWKKSGILWIWVTRREGNGAQEKRCM
jgi:hypothetical protein